MGDLQRRGPVFLAINTLPRRYRQQSTRLQITWIYKYKYPRFDDILIFKYESKEQGDRQNDENTHPRAFAAASIPKQSDI
jgi:hypothetical protein